MLFMRTFFPRHSFYIFSHDFANNCEFFPIIEILATLDKVDYKREFLRAIILAVIDKYISPDRILN
jgi:hypothetical protein